MWPFVGLAFLVFAFATERQTGVSPKGVVVVGACSLALVGIATLRVLHDDHLKEVVVAVVYVGMTVVTDFSLFYYSSGAHHNWSKPLTHLDALVVTFGTLTTAGTADIHPHTEVARGLLLAQMIVDVFLVTILVGLLVGRVAARRSEPADSQQ